MSYMPLARTNAASAAPRGPPEAPKPAPRRLRGCDVAAPCAIGWLPHNCSRAAQRWTHSSHHAVAGSPRLAPGDARAASERRGPPGAAQRGSSISFRGGARRSATSASSRLRPSGIDCGGSWPASVGSGSMNCAKLNLRTSRDWTARRPLERRSGPPWPRRSRRWSGRPTSRRNRWRRRGRRAMCGRRAASGGRCPSATSSRATRRCACARRRKRRGRPSGEALQTLIRSSRRRRASLLKKDVPSGAESGSSTAAAAVARQRGLVAVGIIGCVAGGRPSRFVAGRRAAADAPAADSEGAYSKSADAPTADA